MSSATARVPVLMTPQEKALLTARAHGFNMSVSEYMRKASSEYNPSNDHQDLDLMMKQILSATASAESALDSALDAVEASNKRIEAMERNAKAN